MILQSIHSEYDCYICLLNGYRAEPPPRSLSLRQRLAICYSSSSRSSALSGLLDCLTHQISPGSRLPSLAVPNPNNIVNRKEKSDFF